MHSISSIRLVLCGLMIGLILVFCSQSFAQVGVGIYVNFAPPDLPVYDQPECPGPDYIWTPGYWAWTEDTGYYWVPGTWVMAPEPGYYWTPGYWAGGGNGFFFTPGYWGPVIGFYGGIDYGYGYFGHGYEGGRWDNGRFYYNRTVNNVNVNVIHNTYNTTVVNNTVTRVSYNGGEGGLSARPTAQEQAATRERHIAAVSAQTQHVEAARSNPEMRASANNGRPPIAATAHPGAFQGNGVVAARQAGTVHGPALGTRQAQNQPNNGRPVPRPGAAPQQERPPAPQQERPQVQQQERPRPSQQERPPVPQPERPQGQQQERPPAQRQVPEPPNHENRPNPTHPNDIPPAQHSAPPNSGNSKLDQKYQKQQQKLDNQQSKERQQLQQQQDRDHQRIAQQQANEAQKQQMEQKHQQQTQQMMQRHEQQTQHMQSRQQAPPAPPVHAASRPPEQK
jgi:hypothetical protein